MLGFQEPLDCRTSYSGVLDLRTVRVGSIAASWSSEPPVSPPTGGRELTPSPRDRELTRSPSECSVLTPPRDTSLSPPMLDVVSPTLAITQRVLAAASTPQGTRPFKAYPKDPLTLSAQSDAYLQFRQHMLNQVRGTKQHAKKRPASPTSPYDRQNQQNQQQQPTSSGHESDDKDAAYWERRRKNNEAAKRSRDARRAKEDEIAIRAAFLEQENLRLKYQVAALNDETTKLRCLLYKSDSTAQIRLKSESNLPQNFFKPDSSGQTFFKPESHAPQMLYKPDSSGPHNFYNPDSHSPQMLFKSEHHPKQILYKSECATGI